MLFAVTVLVRLSAIAFPVAFFVAAYNNAPFDLLATLGAVALGTLILNACIPSERTGTADAPHRFDY